MNYRVFFVGIIITILFLIVGLEELAFIMFCASLIGLVYSFTKWKAKKTWEEVKKAEGSSPESKLEGYVKSASKQSAEFLVPPEGTEYNYKGAIHKTPQIAKNVFTELKELLGMK
jgi:flagellar biosynthesis component FlhA